MNPLFFGSSDKALFGIYHAPSAQPGRNRGVVLCNPFGDEAIKAHRAYLQLANRLAAERYHVLRFDYFATGDSAGESELGTVEQWIEDIHTAADELRDASGVVRVSFVGLRFGADLALRAAATRKDVDAVVLWDPVVVGAPYLAKLHDIHESYLRAEFGGREPPASNGEAQVMGFPLPPALGAAIEASDLCEQAPGRVRRARIVSTGAPEHAHLETHLADGSLDVARVEVNVGINWNSDDAMDTSLVPTEAIEAIVSALTAGGSS